MAKHHKPTMSWDANAGLLHIEVPGAIVNIHIGLRAEGNTADVTSIVVLADGERYPDSKPWWIEGEKDLTHHSVRVVRKA
jgi:hypothetical protein